LAPPERPCPLLILGRAPNAPDLALRRLSRAKQEGQALVVIDYQGTLAAHLTSRNRGHMHKASVTWCDLANRRRPVALFRFQRTPGMKPALLAFLRACAANLSEPVSSLAIQSTVDLAWRLAESGSIGLVALARSLRRPEFAQPVRLGGCQPVDFRRLLEMLEWMLRFPAVWALSEANNRVSLPQAMANGGVAWVEIPATHFERLEHRVVSWMVDAVLMDALLSRNDTRPAADGDRHRYAPIVLYGLPTDCPLPVDHGNVKAKHVGLFSFSANHSVPAAARRWLEAGADCWVAGGLGALHADNRTDWLDEVERTRIQQLTPEQVWVRSGQSRLAVTVLVRPPEDQRGPASELRSQALRRLRLCPVKQFSTAHSGQEVVAPQNTQVFETLRQKETLYAGWFRVKTHSRRSHGNDQVTIEQFGNRVDAELDRLASELGEGRYRCRPLRTVRIPKADGDFRVLKIACVRDRVVQAACLHLIEPLFDARFSPTSFAYRPGRGAQHAVALARSAIRAGKHFIVTADIRKCFDSIDHDILLRLVGDVISDRDLIQLLRSWLTADVIDFMDVIPAEVGVHQGEAISPLLANIYLDPLDKEFERAGMLFVRYADDYLVMCDSEAQAQAALRLMEDFLRGVLQLALKPAKTHYNHIDQGASFLGFVIQRDDVRIPADKLSRTMAAIGEHLDAIAAATTSPMDRWQAATHMNALIRGFRNYFLIDDAPGIRAQLAEMDATIVERAADRFGADSGLELIWNSRERFLPEIANVDQAADALAKSSAVSGAYLQDETVRAASRPLSAAAVLAAPATVELPPDAARLSPQGSKDDFDVLLLDGRLHVMTSGCYVTFSGDDIVVRQRKHEAFRAPISTVTMAYLEGRGIAVSADLTMRLCEKDIPVVFTPLVGLPAAIAQPIRSLRSHARQQQALRRNEPEVLMAGLRMLSAKVANQASVLKYFAKYKKRTGDPAFANLSGTADDLRDIAHTLEGLDPAAQGIRAVGMGHEGRAAAKYWAAFASFVPGDLPFPGRHTRHATDPVNSAINYVYTMLYGEVWRAIIRAGLDPYFGIMHGTERDQGSLVFDLIEEFRAPFGDRLVIGLFGRGFALELDKEGHLRAGCRRKIVTAFLKQWTRPIRWRGKLRPPSEILELQVTGLKNLFLGKGSYEPFHFRW
jgi:group II intron reverse transcriptase/maturase/CRISPR-associated endonuclease Cas1